MKFFEFDKLRTAPLIVDAVYEGVGRPEILQMNLCRNSSLTSAQGLETRRFSPIWKRRKRLLCVCSVPDRSPTGPTR